MNTKKYNIPQATVQASSVKASLYFLSQNRTPDLPKTKVADITADKTKRRSMIIGA